MTTNAVATPQSGTSKGLNIALWCVQVLVAVAFGMAGVMKSTTPLPELAQKMAWVNQVPGGLVRFIGISELAGALGMLLPAATRIKPILTPLAGAGLTLVMILAAGFHLSRGEANVIGINAVLGGLAAFVAWGRLKKTPIAPRT